MDDDVITHREHEEFRRLMEAENKRAEDENIRQNKRLDILENKIEEVTIINRSVERLAVNMEGILKEQVAQGNRLQKLEDKDGEMWRQTASYVLTAVLGIVLGFIFKQFGF